MSFYGGEEAFLAEGGARVKFKAVRKGTIAEFLTQHVGYLTAYQKCVADLVQALEVLESSGAAPVLPDGKIGGNAARRVFSKKVDFLVVSKSGKSAGQLVDTENDFCIVSSFDSTEWAVDFYSNDPSVLPTSDTPLHHAALHSCKTSLADVPLISLHGHAVNTEQDADRLQLPCSTVETMFSTPDDTRELLSLMDRYPYPQYKIYIRKGHGFIILHKTVHDVLELFQQKIVSSI